MINEPHDRRSSRHTEEDLFHSETQHTRTTARFNTPRQRFTESQSSPDEETYTHAGRDHAGYANPSRSRVKYTEANEQSRHGNRESIRQHNEYPGYSDRHAHGTRPQQTPHTSTYSHDGQYRRSAADDRAMAENSRLRQQQGRPSYEQNQRHSYSAMGTAAESYKNTSRYARSGQPQSASVNPKPIIIGIAVLAILIGAMFMWVRSWPVEVVVNGTPVEVGGDKTAQYIFDQGVIYVEPGDFVDIEGVVLEEGKGELFTLTINGEPGDPEKKLSKGDEVLFENGGDIEEESTVLEEQTIPYDVVEKGHGPIHKVTQEGSEGKATTKTGTVSNKTITTETAPVQDRIYQRYYPDTNGEKVVAFTFDDGPWGDQTTQVLDILDKYDVKATFFTVGHLIEGEGAEQMKRAAEAGHQVCTHTWDHAAGSGQGVNISYMTKEEQRAEISKGLDAIEAATGTTPSTLFRAPGGNYPLDVWQNTEDLVSAEIGWDVDTEDWRQPGSDVILNRLKNCTPGDIVLMHDGGGNRSQTIAAIDEAIPYLLDQGYRFITIDELMQYPPRSDM